MLAAFLLGGSVAVAQSGSPGDIEARLKREYVGTNRLIRGFYSGAALRYATDGSPLIASPAEPWTTAGVHIEKLDLKKHTLHLRGRRTLLLFDRDADTFKPVDRQVFRGRKPRKEPVSLEIVVADQRNENSIRIALQRVFLGPEEDFSPLVPDYWQEFVQQFRLGKPHDRPSVQSVEPGAVLLVLPDGTKAYRVGGGVKAPRVKQTPDPEYSEAARRAKLHGTTVMRLVVTKTGDTSHIRIVRPLGAGLDEEAVKAIRQWRFSPAEKDGEPVAAVVDVEVSFRLY